LGLDDEVDDVGAREDGGLDDEASSDVVAPDAAAMPAEDGLGAADGDGGGRAEVGLGDEGAHY
jgi:hypothetical protein